MFTMVAGVRMMAVAILVQALIHVHAFQDMTCAPIATDLTIWNAIVRLAVIRRTHPEVVLAMTKLHVRIVRHIVVKQYV